MSYKVFISFCYSDMEIVKPIVDHIESIYNVDVFFSDNSIQPGESISKRIVNAIESTNLFLLFYSEAAKNSSYVGKEIWEANAKEKQLIPVLLDGTVPEEIPTDIRYVDISNEETRETELNALFKTVQRKAQGQNLKEIFGVFAAVGALFWLFSGDDGV